MRYRDPNAWRQKLGIDFNKNDCLKFSITTIGLLLLSYFLVENLAKLSGYLFKPQLLHYKEYLSADFPFHPILGNYLYYIPETLNEEMLLGAVLLMGLQRNFKKLDKNVIAILVALIFSLMHPALYKWSPAQPGILLTFSTVLCLFFVGLLRNALILKTRKIAYSWAIHLSFNLIFFSGFFINQSTNNFASEPERFNVVFDNLPMVLLTGSLAVAAMIWLNLASSSNNLTRRLSVHLNFGKSVNRNRIEGRKEL